MSVDLPEDVGVEDVRRYAWIIGQVAEAINLQGKYDTAADGSDEEAAAEEAVDAHLSELVSHGPETAGEVIAILVNILSTTGDEAKVQEWFDVMASKIRAVLSE